MDASYLTKYKWRSIVGGHYFLGGLPESREPIFLKGFIQTIYNLLNHANEYSTESELGGLFKNARLGKII